MEYDARRDRFGTIRDMLPHGRVAWSILEREGHWDPHIYCGPAALLALTARPAHTLDQLGADCVEGWRPTVEPESAEDRVLVRQANLGVLRFHLGSEHWQAPTQTG